MKNKEVRMKNIMMKDTVLFCTPFQYYLIRLP